MLSLSLAFTMLTVALGLKPANFEFIRTHPRSILYGTAVQLLGLPLMTFGLILLIRPSPGIALGMLIVASCPGGNISNLLTRVGRGNAAYSVSLTMVSSIFAAVLLPFAILFWTSLYGPTATLLKEIELDRVGFLVATAITLVIPLAMGLWLAHFHPKTAEHLNRYFLPVAIVILIALITIGIFNNRELLAKFGTTILPYVVLHNGLAYLLGYLAGRIYLDHTKARALTFEVGIQNTGLGLIIVLAQFGGTGSAAIIVGTWSLWHIFAGFLLANLFRWRDKKAAQPQPPG